MIMMITYTYIKIWYTFTGEDQQPISQNLINIDSEVSEYTHHYLEQHSR